MNMVNPVFQGTSQNMVGVNQMFPGVKIRNTRKNTLGRLTWACYKGVFQSGHSNFE